MLVSLREWADESWRGIWMAISSYLRVQTFCSPRLAGVMSVRMRPAFSSTATCMAAVEAGRDISVAMRPMGIEPEPRSSSMARRVGLASALKTARCSDSSLDPSRCSVLPRMPSR